MTITPTPQSPYEPVTQAIVNELSELLGGEHVLFGDADEIEPYSNDEIPDRSYAHPAEVVVNPSCAEDIAAVMRLANRE